MLIAMRGAASHAAILPRKANTPSQTIAAGAVARKAALRACSIRSLRPRRGDAAGRLMDGVDDVAKVRQHPDVPLFPLGSGHMLDLGHAECIEAVHPCDADLDLGRLAVRVA